MTFSPPHLTCPNELMSSWLLAVATRTLLLDGLSCTCSDRPDTSCSRSAVTLTCCSRTRIRTWARTRDEKGDITWTQDIDIDIDRQTDSQPFVPAGCSAMCCC